MQLTGIAMGRTAVLLTARPFGPRPLACSTASIAAPAIAARRGISVPSALQHQPVQPGLNCRNSRHSSNDSGSSTPGRRRTCIAQAAPAPIAALSAALDGVTNLPNWDVQWGAAAGLAALLWVKAFDLMASRGILEQKLSRKLVHATAGPLFTLTWVVFSMQPNARVVAAAVPSLNMMRLLLVGSGVVSDPGLVASVSREGDRRELLKGPLYYVLVLISITLLFWRDHPAGLVAVALMCGGDGVADIVGRRLGAGNALPWNKAKSWAGSVAMLLAGFGMALGFVWFFCALGYLPGYSPEAMAPAIGIVCLVATLVESLPINHWLDDNLSVPGVAVALSLLLLPQTQPAVAAVAASLPMPGL